MWRILQQTSSSTTVIQQRHIFMSLSSHLLGCEVLAAKAAADAATAPCQEIHFWTSAWSKTRLGLRGALLVGQDAAK